MNNKSKHTWPSRAETPKEKLIRLEWLSQQDKLMLVDSKQEAQLLQATTVEARKSPGAET